MTLRMLDSIYPQNLPPGADAYAGYLDGSWPDFQAEVARFPGKHILSIAVTAADDADCLDVETRDATIPQVYGWFVRQQKRGAWRPVIYTSAGNLHALLLTMDANGFHRSSYRIWAAHYGAGEHICGPGSCGYPAADATQWRDDAPGAGGAWVDESLLLDSFFPAAPKPPPPPSPVPRLGTRTGDTMLYLPTGAGAVSALPVPTAVLTADGSIAAPSALRLVSNAPASVQYMLGESGRWVPLAIDYARSPAEVQLDGAAVVKVQRVDAGTNLVTADFA